MTVTTVSKSATCGGGHHYMPRRQNPQRSAPLQWLHRWPGPNDGVPRNATGPCSVGLTIAATSLGFVMVQLDVSILNVALARIGEAVATDITGLQWVVDAYTIAFASLLLAAGALGDRFGARRVYISGFVVFVLASLGCGLAPGAGALIAARAAQGVGAALLVPCSLTLLTHACGDDRAARARAVSLWTAAASVALSAGPVLGGLLVDTLGWRSIFLLNIPVGAAGIWLTRRFITDTTPSNGGLDPVGQALALLMLLALIGAVIEAGRLGLGPLVLSGFGIAVLSGAAFAAVEARSPDPMLPLSFFREPAFSATTLVGLLINLTLYGAIFVLSLYLQQVRGYSPMAAGLAFLPFPVVLGMANVAAGWVGSWAGLSLPMAFGLLVAGAGFWLLRHLGATSSYASILAGMIVIPAGIGLAVPLMTSVLLSSVPRSRAGIASGVLNTVRQAGGGMGVALFGALMARRGLPGVQTALMVANALLVCGAVIAALGVRRLRDSAN
jgi:DHA2 family methylenomycin A resistance protein-like MFS transporter